MFDVIELMETYELSRQEFADVIGVKRQAVDHWVNGSRSPDRYSKHMIEQNFIKKKFKKKTKKRKNLEN